MSTSSSSSRLAPEALALAPVALVAALYATRIAYTGDPLFGYLLFNVGLAVIPAALGWLAFTLHARGEKRATVAVLGAWLLFLPNAPYVITDLIHLRAQPDAPLWYDAAILGTAAFAGLVLGVVSLMRVQAIVARERGAITANITVLIASLASGYGIYLGRFSRLNSWDVALHPTRVIAHALPPILDPVGHPRAWAVTLVFGAVLGVAYLVFHGAERREAQSG